MTAKRPQPRYKQMAETLMEYIRSGEYQVGELMPGEHELVAKFGVSRHTVRESLRLLEELGLIERLRGHGTVVKAQDSQPTYVQAVRSPNELMQYPSNSRLMLIETEQLVTKRKLARTLCCRSGTPWVRLGVLRQLDSGLPICWTDIYLRPEYAAVADEIGQSKKYVYQLLEKAFDLEVRDVEIDIRASSLDDEKAQLLHVASGSPSLTLIRRYVGDDQNYLQISVSQHPAEHFNYSLRLQRGWQSQGGWATR